MSNFSLSIQPCNGVKIANSTFFSSYLGTLPTTSASPPAFENGATSAAANNTFIFPPYLF